MSNKKLKKRIKKLERRVYTLECITAVKQPLGKVTDIVQTESGIQIHAQLFDSPDYIYANFGGHSLPSVIADDGEDLDMFRKNRPSRCPQDPDGLHFYQGTICVYCGCADPNITVTG